MRTRGNGGAADHRDDTPKSEKQKIKINFFTTPPSSRNYGFL
jgi:hypothetical protein